MPRKNTGSKKDKEIKKILTEFEALDMSEISRRMHEDQRKRIDKKNRERQELLDSFDKELETGSKCRVCTNSIVEKRTRKFERRTGTELIGGCGSAMGELPPISYKSKYYCRNCRIKYEPPLPKKSRT